MLKLFFFKFFKKSLLSKKGSALVLSIFLVISLSIIAISYWKIIEIYAQSIYLRERNLQARQIARAGIEDAIFELLEGNNWVEADITPQGWTKAAGSNFNRLDDILSSHGWADVSDNIYYKSTGEGSLNAALFNINSTFSVTVSGNPETSRVDLLSIGEVSSTDDTKSFLTILHSKIIKSPAGEIYTLEMKEL
ncbi:hypothetical protein ACFL2K_03890 [Candidatus Margulisiibacteriota bacterium]